MKYVETEVYRKKPVREKSKSFYGRVKTIAITLLIILLLVFFCSFLFKSKSVVLKKQTVYGVAIGSFVTESSANYYSSICKTRGGAGGIYQDGNNFMVFAALYLSKTDANTIANNLLEAGESAYVYEWDLPQKKLTFSDGSKSMLVEVTEVFWNTLSMIVSLALDYDKEEKSVGDVNDVISERIDATDEAISLAEKLKGDSTEQIIQDILSYLAYQKTILTQLKKSVVKTSELKIAYFDLLLINLSLREKF